jgi:hypothetical protein
VDIDIKISLDYGVTLLAALFIGTGFVLQQNAAERAPDSRFLSLRLMADLLRAPRWVAGIGCMIAGQVLAAWSIGHLSLTFVEPLLTTNLVFALVLAVPIAKASLKLWEILGAAVLCTGVALLSASRSAKPIGLSFGSFSHWPAAALIAFVAFVAVHAGRRWCGPGRARAMLTGTGAGLVFGIQDALTRQTLQILQGGGIGALFTDWAPYALVGAGATGIWLMQSAFSAGPLQVSLPAISAGEPLVGIALGVVVFGDRIQVTPGELAIQAGGIAALIAGVIMVGRAPAFSQLRAHVPPLPHVPHVPHVPQLLPHVQLSLPGLHTGRGDGDEPPRHEVPDEDAPPAADETPQATRPDMRGLPPVDPRGGNEPQLKEISAGSARAGIGSTPSCGRSTESSRPPDRSQLLHGLCINSAAEIRHAGLPGRLGLEPKAAKTRIVHLAVGEEGFDFLGFHHRHSI